MFWVTFLNGDSIVLRGTLRSSGGDVRVWSKEAGLGGPKVLGDLLAKACVGSNPTPRTRNKKLTQIIQKNRARDRYYRVDYSNH